MAVNRVGHLLSSMPRRKEEKKPFGTYLPIRLLDELGAYSEASERPIARIVEDALTQYLQALGFALDDEDDQDTLRKTRGGKR